MTCKKFVHFTPNNAEKKKLPKVPEVSEPEPELSKVPEPTGLISLLPLICLSCGQSQSLRRGPSLGGNLNHGHRLLQPREPK